MTNPKIMMSHFTILNHVCFVYSLNVNVIKHVCNFDTLI